MADAPLLGGGDDATRSTGSRIKNARSVDSHRGTLRSIFKIFAGGLIAPADTTYATIMLLLNCEDLQEQDELTTRWRDHKLNELSFIGVTSPLTAVCLVSTGSWPEISSKPWFIRGFWYCGIVFALFSVLTAAQQSMRLHRLSAHRDGLHLIRLCLVRDRKPLDSEGGQLKLVPRPFQIWGWQSAMMFLLLAVACLIVGLLALVWVAVMQDNSSDVWAEDFKLAITFTVVLMCSVVYLLATQVSMMVGVAVE